MTALRGGRSWGSKLHWQPVRLWYMIALTISRIWYLPWWPLTEGCAAFHAVITGSIRAHRSSDKSVAYGLRSLTRLSQHVHAHQPGITLQIHSITVRHHGHRLTDRPLREWPCTDPSGCVLLRPNGCGCGFCSDKLDER